MRCRLGSEIGAATRSIRLGAALLIGCALAACGGGGVSDLNNSDGSLFVGYYVEDADNNPEDPTIGALLLRLPSVDGSFAGQMPFSYAGCAAGSDVGAISGSRVGSSFAGGWTGTMDGSAVGGSFDLAADASGGTYSGHYTNAAGKQAISVGACSYYVAKQGKVKLFPADSSSPAEFVISVRNGVTPTLSWPSLGSAVLYSVRVFDEACLQVRPSDAACFKGEVATTALNAVLDASWGLTTGVRYRTVVTAQQVSGGFAGFATITFVPTVATGGGSDVGASGIAGRGRLAIGGSGATALGSEFVTGADVSGVSVTVVASGPTCSGSGALRSCASYLDLSWGEYDGLLPREFVSVHFTSSTSTDPGNPPGSGITSVIVVAGRVDRSASFGLVCGPLAGTCESMTDLGIALDNAARTVTFTNVMLPSQGGDGASIVLNGTLTY